jgi:hypothetical protein
VVNTLEIVTMVVVKTTLYRIVTKCGQYWKIVTVSVVNTLEIVTVSVVNTLEIVTVSVVNTLEIVTVSVVNTVE